MKKPINEYVKMVLDSLLTEETRLPYDIALPEELLDISKIFIDNGSQFYIVGGCVRDAVMGKLPKDFDIATNITPDQVIELLTPHKEYKLLDIGKAFGVIVIVPPSGEQYEVATFRKDLSGGRRPDAVEFTTIEQDVKRRDLTINGLFYNVQTHEIVDFVGGLDDIKNKIVRTIGDPRLRFDEDRLRILRAFRFAFRMGARLDAETEKAIKDDNNLTGVSAERIRDEFLKGIKSAKSVVSFLSSLFEFNMFSQIFPGLKVGPAMLQTKNVPVQLATLLENNDSIVLAAKLNSLKYSAEEVSQITFLIDFKNAGENMPILRMKKSFANSKLTPDDLLEYAKANNMSELAKSFLAFRPTVSPADLMAQGLKGKELGEALAKQEQALWLSSLS